MLRCRTTSICAFLLTNIALHALDAARPLLHPRAALTLFPILVGFRPRPGIRRGRRGQSFSRARRAGIFCHVEECEEGWLTRISLNKVHYTLHKSALRAPRSLFLACYATSTQTRRSCGSI
ncbi:hypothetical protein FIBSPDRAFT_248970 [Athelia psychrophila]|uniref:Secreted protein n=1 Tax=Athelia psychrophila TaxID=1759441 RepID=A0A165XYU3_9AGAM|nr:hypothetical protein FIBSPDRAFT_248970 [Fibularhizoctonia sp. CBS 109695]